MATYNLSEEADVAKFKTRVDYLIHRGRMVTLVENTEPKEQTKEEKIRRRQMNLLHLWLAYFGDYVGEIDKEQVKTDVKRAILGIRMSYNRFSKRNEPSDYHLSQMSVQEASIFMEKFKIWAQTEYGCYLPYENEVGYGQMATAYRNR